MTSAKRADAAPQMKAVHKMIDPEYRPVFLIHLEHATSSVMAIQTPTISSRSAMSMLDTPAIRKAPATVLRTATVIRIGFRSHLAAVDSSCGAGPAMNGDSLPRELAEVPCGLSEL